MIFVFLGLIQNLRIEQLTSELPKLAKLHLYIYIYPNLDSPELLKIGCPLDMNGIP